MRLNISLHWLPVLLDHINDNSMVLMLLQPAHNNHRHSPLNSTNADGDSAAVDSVRGSLVLAHPELGRKGILIPGILEA